MGLIKTLSIAIGLIAVGIGVVGKLYPEIFLHIPNVGFIPFMMLGGNNGILPPFFDIEPWQGEESREWLRDGDVVVATGAKAGTTWMCYCMDAIRRKGSDAVGLPYTDIMLTTPWMEATQQPGQGWAARKALYNSTVLPDGSKLKDYWDHADFPFRVFKSHYTPNGPGKVDVLPVKDRPNVKFLVAVRHPLEVAKSIHNFFPKHSPEFRKMWGGFPPIYPNPEAAMKALLPGAELYDFYFGYVKSWWPYLKEPNVLALHYTDMVKDVDGLVDKLAKFAGVSLNADEKGKVAEKCSFAYMKKHSQFFDYKLPVSPRVGWDFGIMKSGAHINKGESGDGEKGISEEGLKEFTAAIDSELADPAMKKWALEGGEI